MHKIKWKSLIISLILSFGIGALSGFLTSGSMEVYKKLKQPPLSPPAAVFPFVWTVLFLLMGISAYLIYNENAYDSGKALLLYGVQLLVNFLWPIFFFNMHLYLFSFIWILFLWVLIILMIRQFYKINKTAAYLQIPYLLWVTFAAYLNLAVALLNK
ncbi:MAG TPA: TspO/MBR family protein [Oscillospiraceae bacterium]|nr:TspO/MBR family protein [Oscillospiraceae bacterium]